jgi:hypothetical protein
LNANPSHKRRAHSPRLYSRVATLIGCLLPYSTHAHHSYAPYDDTRIVELEGTLVDVAWQNPHVHFKVETVGADQRRVTWDVETVGLNQLQRLRVPLDVYRAGQRVKVAGWPARRASDRMYGTNLMSADGQELVLWRDYSLRWATAGFGYTDRTPFSAGRPTDTDTIFRVWTSDYDDPDAAPAALFGRTQLPFNEAAKKAAAAFNPVVDTTTVGCTPKGMPQIMGQPMPIEFVDRGDAIVLRLEEYDTVRTIHMADTAQPRLQDGSPLGHSVGRWEGKTLVVDTTGLRAGFLAQRGQPIGSSARLHERFTVSADGSRLHYVLTVTDPDNYTRPFEVGRSWVWRPGEQVMTYNCAQ